MSTSKKIFDQLLVLKCQSGDDKSLSLLVKRWHSKLFDRIIYLTKDREASSDILQETWKSIVKNIKKLKDPARFSSWAYTIANRKSYDWIRAEQKSRTVFDASVEKEKESSELTVDESDPINRIKSMIQSFEQDEQLILTLFYLENYSLKEISKLTQIPVGTVKSKLFYSREKLKSTLKKGLYDV